VHTSPTSTSTASPQPTQATTRTSSTAQDHRQAAFGAHGTLGPGSSPNG
jgi:hypothetical protein